MIVYDLFLIILFKKYKLKISIYIYILNYLYAHVRASAKWLKH